MADITPPEEKLPVLGHGVEYRHGLAMRRALERERLDGAYSFLAAVFLSKCGPHSNVGPARDTGAIGSAAAAGLVNTGAHQWPSPAGEERTPATFTAPRPGRAIELD